MGHYKPVQVTITNPRLAEVIIDIVMRYHGLSDLIITDQGLLFTLKFWLALYYFFDIKQRLFTTFYLQTDSKTKRPNSMMEAYLQAFINFEYNNLTWLVLIAEFVCSNTLNICID